MSTPAGQMVVLLLTPEQVREAKSLIEWAAHEMKEPCSSAHALHYEIARQQKDQPAVKAIACAAIVEQLQRLLEHERQCKPLTDTNNST